MEASNPAAPAQPASTALFTGALEPLLLAASVFWALGANRLFFAAALKDRALTQPDTWVFALALLVMLVAVNFLLLSLLCTRHTVKPVLAVLAVATALATHFMQNYGAYLDPSMLRNVLRTDVANVYGKSLPRSLFSRMIDVATAAEMLEYYGTLAGSVGARSARPGRR